MVITVAGAQIGSIWENPVRSLSKAEPYVRVAAEQGVSLLCLPEQYPTGWDPRSLLHLQDRSGPVTSRFRDLAREYGIAILGSFRERSGTGPRNTCIVLDSEGEVIASYAKCHLFTPAGEGEGYSPGDTLGIFRLEGVPFGIAICYDLRFSELFSRYAEEGVCCMLVPAAWPASRIGHWELLIRARALEYQFFVFGVNTTGTNPVDTYDGGSLAADPSGAVIARSGRDEGLMTAAIDPDLVFRTRESLPVGRDRRPDLCHTMRAREG